MPCIAGIVALKTNKNSFKLAAKTPLCPETENSSRLDSTGEMISKVLMLRENFRLMLVLTNKP